MYHVPIIRKDSIQYDPISAIASVISIGAGQTATSIQQGTQTRKAAKSAAEAAVDRQRKASEALKEAEASAAAQAQARISSRKKRIIKGSKTVYTSPLGVEEEASVARKTLLGS